MTTSKVSLLDIGQLQMGLLRALGVEEEHVCSAHIVMDQGRIRVRITKYVYPYEVVNDRLREVVARYEVSAVKRQDPTE